MVQDCTRRERDVLCGRAPAGVALAEPHRDPQGGPAMFASIRTYRVGTGSVDDVLHRVDRELADAFAREPGFISYEVVRTGERTLASITTFHEREQAEASNELAADWV